MAKEKIIRGKAYLITAKDGKLIDDIDTDQIFHNKHLAITDRKEMGKYAFGNLQGYEDFPKRFEPGGIIIVGKNFGSGSSRAQAVDCFLSIGASLIIGKSFGAIYWRNAINAGLPIIRAPEFDETLVSEGDELEINLETGEMKNITKSIMLKPAIPFSSVQFEIYEACGLFNYGRKIISA